LSKRGGRKRKGSRPRGPEPEVKAGALVLTRLFALAVVAAAALIASLALILRSVYRTNSGPTKPVVLLKEGPSSAPAPTFVGAPTCGVCHEDQLKRWTGSHHQVAMQAATDATVLGDFNRVRFTNAGVASTFFRRGGKFMVRTDGPDGALHDYQIKFTFGVSPIQQYLIAMAGGRLQALGIAWDSRRRERGGQRWFFLYPGRTIPASNPQHWTAMDQTWNYMCADCHSTNVRKNYDLHSGTYATSYAEIDVACEACHGPGSNHVMWAKKQGGWKKFDANEGLTIALDERKGARWIIEPATEVPRRSMPRDSEREIQMCARCHARRGQIHEDYVHGQPAGDDYRVALLEDDLYFPRRSNQGRSLRVWFFHPEPDVPCQCNLQRLP
jgi:cytochrome c553